MNDVIIYLNFCFGEQEKSGEVDSPFIEFINLKKHISTDLLNILIVFWTFNYVSNSFNT